MKRADRQTGIILPLFKTVHNSKKFVLVVGDRDISRLSGYGVSVVPDTVVSSIFLSFIALSFKTLCLILGNTDEEACVPVISNSSTVLA
jgi:hypothetical protein